MTRRTPTSQADAGSPTRRVGAIARLLRAPVALAAGALVAAWASARLGGGVAYALLGAVAGAWGGLWAGRRLPGHADLRWLLPAPAVAGGLVLGGITAAPALVGTALVALVAATARHLPRRLSGSELDEPRGVACALVLLGGGAVLIAAGTAFGAGGAIGTAGWSTVAAGAVSAFALALAFATDREDDPFVESPDRRGLVLAAVLVIVAVALGLWAPRLVPLSMLALVAYAASGRPRTLAVVGAFLAPVVVLVATYRPDWLRTAFGGWSTESVLALLAAGLAVAFVASLVTFQRDRLRARLRAASSHLFTLAEKSPGLVATLDRDLRHRGVNQAYQAWTARKADALAGMLLVDVLGPAAVERMRTSLARALAGASQHLQIEARERMLDVRLEPWFGLDGAIAGVHLLADDVTWRGQGERDMRSLLAAAPEPTLVLEENGLILFHNALALQLFGVESSELVGTPLTAWLAEAPQSAAADASAGMRARRRDGSVFPVELRLGSMPGDHGGRSVVSLRDLSAQHALEDAARTAREQAQATLDSISDALVVCDPSGTITAFNPAASELTGWSRDEAVGRGLEEVVKLVEPAKGVPQQSVLREVLRTGRPARLEGERELVRRDGSHRPIEESASPLYDRTHRPVGAVLMFHDVTHVREQAQALSHMAQHDFLTGLPNRVLFQDRLTQALATVGQGGKGAVLYMDLDKFKPINDTLGHPVGDKVLQEVAKRLRTCVRADDTVSRQGGDEFVLLLVRLADPRDAARVAEKLIRSIEEPILVDGHELRVGASVGISLFPQDGRDARMLMKAADTALYHVKESGRGRYSYFTYQMGEHADARMRMEYDLRLALMSEDFVLDYQPVVDTRDGHFRAVEALLRWRRMDGTVLLPETFLSVAEETGLILQIDEWVMRKACLQNAAWQQAGLPRCPVSINVSLARFDAARLLGQIDAALGETTLDPKWLEVEFRGEQLFPLGEAGRSLVADLRAMGVAVAVDDVASSQASVAQLVDFGFDTFKLDLAVVGALSDDERARRIGEAVCRAGAALGCPVIAKGVESEAHRDLLAEWGCDGMQGALFFPPMASDLLPSMLDPSQPTSLARRA
jgi:diguanylate cyclase (GGDEF)-like protein/PAS domain S-box-containing protein